MNDQNPQRHPISRPSDDKERWEREKAEDERRYQHYLKTGEFISHEDMKVWFDQLEQAAVNVFANRR